MPFTRIILRQGYSHAQIMQISDILQQSLEQEFAVPPSDRFQVFEELPARLRVFDRLIKVADVAIILFSSISLRAGRVHWHKSKT